MLDEGIPGKNVTWMIRGPPRAPDRLLESFGTHARRSEVFETMMGACGPLNSGGSATGISKPMHTTEDNFSICLTLCIHIMFFF